MWFNPDKARSAAVSIGMICLALQAQAQTSQQYLSDRTWTSSTNGMGPVERDKSNGAEGFGDGEYQVMKGTVYAKGLGVYANSEIRVNLRGVCSAFTSDVGLDDRLGRGGSIVFQVWADGEKLYESGVLTDSSAVEQISVDLTGRKELVLISNDAGDGSERDFGDWGNAVLTCDRIGVPTEAMRLEGQKDVVISGVSITSTDKPCLVITENSENIRIENSELGPCPGGIIVEGGKNITIENVYIHDTGKDGNGIDVTFSENVRIANNSFERVRSGVYALRTTGITVERNQFLNIQGPLPRGQFVQFNHVVGAGNSINCNIGENVLELSDIVEGINVYDSFGESTSPIKVIGNRIMGGGPSESSGAILLGDGGGSFQIASDNIIADPGQQGIGVAGGNDIAVVNNHVVARQQPFTNVGLYVWNQDISKCYNITVEGNNISWTNRDGTSNPFWNAENCGTINGLNNNNFNMSITKDLLNQPIAACKVDPSPLQ